MGVIALTAFTMFFVAGGQPVAARRADRRSRWAPSAYMVVRSDYQMDRIHAFLDPWADPQGLGFQTVQGLLALGSGGVLGIGLGESRQPGRPAPAAGAERLRVRRRRPGAGVHRRRRW